MHLIDDLVIMNSKKIEFLVVDTGAFLKNASIQVYSVNSNLKDENTLCMRGVMFRTFISCELV